MKAWLKGGLWGLGIFFLATAIFFLGRIGNYGSDISGPGVVAFYLIIILIIFSLVGFILGALIGFIIGKFKNRNKQNQRVKQK